LRFGDIRVCSECVCGSANGGYVRMKRCVMCSRSLGQSVDLSMPYNHLLVLPLLLFNFQVSISLLSFSFIFGRAKPSPSNARHFPFPGRILSGLSNELNQVSARFSFVNVSPFKLEAVLAFSFAPRAFCVFCWLLSETLGLSRSL
jgi:hypothetical protein